MASFLMLNMLNKGNLLVLFIVSLLRPVSLYAQIDSNNIHFDIISTDSRNMIRESGTFSAHDNRVYAFEDFLEGSIKGVSQNVKPKSPILLGVKLNPGLTNYNSADIKSIAKSYSSYIISDSSEAVLIALGITAENIDDYRYHVVENDSVEVIPWSPIPKLEQNYGARKPYGLIGRFNSPGKQLMIEVLNMKSYHIRDGVVFDWRTNFKPVINQIKIKGREEDDYYNINFAKRNRSYATRFDKKTGLPLDLKFPVDSVQRIDFYFSNHETVPYVIYRIRNIAGKVDTARLSWWMLNDRYTLYNQDFRNAGEYEIIIQRVGKLDDYSEEQKLRISFEVLTSPMLQKKIALKEILPYGAGALLAGSLLFVLYYRNNQAKLVKSAIVKQTVSLRLRSIRSQLNPHFMYNALSSIQNLINRNDIDAANHYLSKFSSLTRKVLFSGEKEMITLEDEIQIVEEYLQMEQLRFGFRYSLRIEKSLNLQNLEIPAMLLQPIIENAVKHGVSMLKEQGLIEIGFMARDGNLILLVSDNGKGMNISAKKDANSFGLKLSEERIKLLNQMYNEQVASLKFQSDSSGTSVIITLDNWL